MEKTVNKLIEMYSTTRERYGEKLVYKGNIAISVVDLRTDEYLDIRYRINVYSYGFLVMQVFIDNQDCIDIYLSKEADASKTTSRHLNIAKDFIRLVTYTDISKEFEMAKKDTYRY